MGVGVRSMPTGSFGWGGLMLKDPKPPMNPKETSLTTHPEASTQMYGIKKKLNQKIKIFFFKFYSPQKQYNDTQLIFFHVTSDEDHHRPEINIYVYMYMSSSSF